MRALRSQLSCGLGPPLLEHIPALVCLPYLSVFVVNSLSCCYLLLLDFVCDFTGLVLDFISVFRGEVCAIGDFFSMPICGCPGCAGCVPCACCSIIILCSFCLFNISSCSAKWNHTAHVLG